MSHFGYLESGHPSYGNHKREKGICLLEKRTLYWMLCDPQCSCDSQCSCIHCKYFLCVHAVEMLIQNSKLLTEKSDCQHLVHYQSHSYQEVKKRAKCGILNGVVLVLPGTLGLRWGKGLFTVLNVSECILLAPLLWTCDNTLRWEHVADQNYLPHG